jgi:hypothetical protein
MNDLVDSFLNKLEKDKDSSSSKESSNEIQNDIENELPNETIELQIGTIDFTDSFSLLDMIKPAVPYASDEDVVRDLGRILRYVAQGSTFIFKYWSSATSSYQNSFVVKHQMKNDLSIIKLNYGENENHSVWDAFSKYYSLFTVMGVHFPKKMLIVCIICSEVGNIPHKKKLIFHCWKNIFNLFLKSFVILIRLVLII